MSRVMEICFEQRGARAAVAIMRRLFNEGWETLNAVKWDPEHERYLTTLYLPHAGKGGSP